MLPTIKIKNKILNFKLQEDRAILLICIGIALVFWLLVKLSQRYTTVRQVTFDFEIPEGKALADAPPKDMRVEIEGTGWDLLFDYFSNPVIELSYDLSQTDNLLLSRSQLRSEILRQLSSGDIKISEINYESIDLELEEKVTKTVPVQLQRKLSFGPEYHLRDSIELAPDSVSVTGPVSAVEQIERWSTDSLIIQNLKSDMIRKLSLQPPPQVVSLSTRQIEIHIPVEQYTEKSLFVELEVENVPDQIDSIRFFPQRVRVNCVVGLSQYNEVTENDFKLVADLKGASLEEGRNRVSIELTTRPDYVKNIQFSPKTAEFFIVKKQEPSSEE